MAFTRGAGILRPRVRFASTGQHVHADLPGTATVEGSGNATVAVQQAAQSFAVSIRNQGELTLGYRLETADGTVLIDRKEKRSARADDEDLLTRSRRRPVSASGKQPGGSPMR